MNLRHKVLTGNPTGNSRCQALASRALNTSCYFGQSARSIESRCVVRFMLHLLAGSLSVSVRCVLCFSWKWWKVIHYSDVRMSGIASQITSLTIVNSAVYSDTDQRKYQSSASLAFVWEIHRGLVNSPHKGPVTRKMFPFDDVIM